MVTTGSLASGACTLTRFIKSKKIHDSGLMYFGSPCLGSRRKLEPVASGVFTPGQFRVNPVVIEKGLGTATLASLETSPRIYDMSVYKLTGSWITNWVDSTDLSSVPWQQNNANWVLEQAYAKLNEAPLDVAMMLGEIGETVKMLRHPFEEFVKYTADRNFVTDMRRVYKRRNVVKYIHKSPHVSFAANSWLLYDYGIAPFIRDVSSIIDAINKGLGNQALSIMSKRSGLTHSTTNVDVRTRQNVANFVVTPQWTKKVEYRHTAHVYCQQALLLGSGLHANQLGFSWEQIPGLAWELVPYSFVVDWVFAVGSWLRALMPLLPQFSYLGNCVTQKSVCTYTLEGLAVASGYSDCNMVKNDTGKYTWVAERLERRVMATKPVLPAFTVDKFGFKQLIDSLALIWGRIPKKLRTYR